MNKGMLLRTTDKAATWQKLCTLPPEIQGGHLLFSTKNSSLALIGVAQGSSFPSNALSPW